MRPSGFLRDMGVSPRVETMIRELGFMVQHARDVVLSTADDGEIIDLARAKSLVVVTTDTDLSTIVALQGATMPSVITLRLENPSAAEQCAALAPMLTSVGLDGLASALFTVERGRYRRRTLPVGGTHVASTRPDTTR